MGSLRPLADPCNKVLQGGKISLRQLDDPATAENWLRDKGGEIAGALPVYQLESVVELRLPINAGKAGTIGVRSRYREATGCHGTVAATARLVGGRRGGTGHAVPRLREPPHLPAP